MRTSRLPLLLMLFVPLLLTGPPASADDIRWSVAPADRDGPDGRISLRHVAEPGEQVRDRIAVTNLGPRKESFDVLAGDGTVGGDGAFDIAAGEAEGSGAWVRVGGLRDGRVSVPAEGTRVLPIVVSVPEGATPGDQPAGIVVARSADEDGTTVTHRIGVRLHLQVDGSLTPQLEVSDVETSFEPSLVPFAPGTLTATYRVTNVGNVRLGAGAEVTAGLPFGLLERSGTTTRDELLPGDSAELSTTVPAWPTFVSTGSVRVDGLVVGEDRGSPAPTMEHTIVRPAVSWTGLAVLVLLGLVTWWRRRPGPTAVTSTTSPQEAPRQSVDA